MYTVQALWSMARQKAAIVIVVLKNDAYAILDLEVARVREKETNAMLVTPPRRPPARARRAPRSI